MHDLKVPILDSLPYVRAGFHAEVHDAPSGLVHAGEQWAPARFLVQEHSHPVWELYLQAHGRTRWRAGQEAYTVGPGDLFGVAPGVVHRMVETAASNHHFYFAAIDITRPLSRMPRLAGTWSGLPPSVHRPGADLLRPAFEQLISEIATEREFAAAGLTAAVDRLVLEFARAVSSATPAPRIDRHPAIAKVQDLLDHHFERSWSLADLGEIAGLAPTYLAAQFTRAVGTSPRQYLLARRIDRAKHLLATSNLSITAVGVDVGFASSQHFSRKFRSVTGQSPREYRAFSGA